MPANLRNFGTIVVTALIALANPTHAFVDETCAEAVRRTAVADARTVPADANDGPSDDNTDPADDDNGDGAQGAVDLGNQPILLLNHAFKPIPPSAPAPTEFRVVAVVRLIREVDARPLLACADSDGVTLVWPCRHTGISLMPHGPPGAMA